MKFLTALIKPFKLEEVKDALAELRIDGMTVTEVKGFGISPGQGEIRRGGKRVRNLVPKLKIEVAVPDYLAMAAMEGIVKSANAGTIGDDAIWVLPLDEIVRIRTDDRGAAAFYPINSTGGQS